MADFAIFADLFELVDEQTMHFATEISGRAVTAISPIVVVGLTLAFIMHGLLIVRGMVDSPLMEFLGRSVKIALIVGVAMGAGFYQGEIAEAIRTLPDGLATALIADPAANGASAANVVDQAAGMGFGVVGEAWEKANVLSTDAFLYALIGFAYLVFTIAVVAIGGAFILMSKIGLALVAGLGPLFIISLAWQPTAKFFELWLGQVANYTMMVVIFSATFGFMMDIFSATLTGLTLDDGMNLAYNIGAIGILSVAMVIIILQLPSLASGLAAGVSIGTLHELRAIAKGAQLAGAGAKGAAKAGYAAGKGAVAGTHAGLAGAHAFATGGQLGLAGARAGQVAKGYYKSRGAKAA